MTPHIANGVWSVDIRVKTEGDIIQNGTLVNPMNPERLNKMERSYEAEVNERIEGALDELSIGKRQILPASRQPSTGNIPSSGPRRKIAGTPFSPR
nr:Ger(x)C family spore germination C-terminal domain-containing protein [Cohnella thermotolerans]